VAKLERALALLDRFESEDRLLPQEAERLVVEIFEACGHAVTDKGFIGGDTGVDCYVQADVDGRSQRIGVEVKSVRQPVGVAAFDQAFRLKASGHFDRTMVISRSGYSKQALQLAETVGLGQVDLFGPKDLRNWLSKYSQPDQPNQIDETCVLIVRRAMRALARRLAEHPEELPTIEWRDLERILRETFEGLGFDTALTRSGKDGGFDLELVTTASGTRQSYLVEVKHWTDQRPGSAHLKKLVRVTTSKKATGALLLSTSGFASTIYSGLAEMSAPVRLGDGSKVISLCKAYYRLGSALWLEARDLQDTLFSGTQAIGEYPQ
jgi:restriction system protein